VYKIKKQIIMLISFIFLLTAFSNTVSADQSIIYVNDSSGNDSWTGETTTWDGSTLLGPKKSIKNATGTVTEGGIVNIANGQYTGTDNTNIIIDKNMTISGESQANTIINAQNLGRIFNTKNNSTVTLLNLTLTNGNDLDKGGAISNEGNLMVIDCKFINNNAAAFGGAINSEPNCSLIVINSTFTNNNANFGGAIENYNGYSIIIGSNFTNNSANNGGGAIQSFTSIGDSIISGRTFTGNYTGSNGGAF
jgi:predicted outer membrane repeat protein